MQYLTCATVCHNLRVVESGFWMQGNLSKDVETLSTHLGTQTAVSGKQLEISDLFNRKFVDLLLLAYEVLRNSVVHHSVCSFSVNYVMSCESL